MGTADRLSPTSFEGTILILGATGAVGQEFVQLLSERRWPADRLRLVASAQSADRQITYLEQNLIVERLEALAR